ncbi:4Fe-4S binding protein [Kiloniella laminariae]|uniref:4Fe-4S binding protein n=1 Tax=Kiloniella laminariae TaxID=454162 RepID=A0ABT4LJZ2_9PROT|nr:NosR/NirI family protein [Kiloniella laminariae]MCZ4281406.1 4Fe-4S binding protein [Kiloniella laminariae]
MPDQKAWAQDTKNLHQGSDTAALTPVFSQGTVLVHAVVALLVSLSLLFVLTAPGLAESKSYAAPSGGNFARYSNEIIAEELFPGASSLEPVAATPPYAKIIADGEEVGFAYLNTDFVNATGYSGKPIHVMVGIDLKGVITGTKLVKHSEPIVLIGIPEKKITNFMAGYTGIDTIARTGKGRDTGEVDMISGATVTIMVIEDSIFRSAIKFARHIGIGGLSAAVEQQPSERRTVDLSQTTPVDWETLLGNGAVRHRVISLGGINAAFAESGDPVAAKRPEKGDPEETYIDLYLAPVSVPVIGRTLLGEAEYQNLLASLEPGQEAIMVFANGRYSFKGSGYVRGGIFDRFQLIQGENSVRFRDKLHTRIGDLEAEGSPAFKEIGIFRIPTNVPFNPAETFRIELLANREVGAIKKVFLAFDLSYDLPASYVKVEKLAPVLPAAISPEVTATDQSEDASRTALWKRMWDLKQLEIGALSLALAVLTVIFFFQDWLVKHPRLLVWTRNSFLTFTLFFVGFYAQAQLSVVNVLTFFNALLTDFSWNYFLMEPLIFLLWLSVAGGLLFWGRGAYCGWLCPFGALQELVNQIAKRCKVPQFELPWGLHERLWPLKYIIFLALFGLSLYSLQDAEHWAEIEPFKTAIILKFAREWPWVLFAISLLAAGLFVERFYCRYLCPLGAALAIPGRMRMFEWLKRHPKDCGKPCQTCAKECMVQAIHPTGEINPNECLYCLHCQVVYHDDHRCPPMVQKRKRSERLQDMQSKSAELIKGGCPAAEIPDFIGVDDKKQAVLSAKGK